MGQGLAFDPALGRLWIVCRACRGWNLAPLVERWEPLEELERVFRTVRVEASSENVALGRARDGTALIRVGGVDRREFASWRYARRLRTRWRRAEGVGWVVMCGPVLAGMSTGVSMTLAMPASVGLAAGVLLWRDRQRLFRTADGQTVRMGDASQARLVPGEHDGGWQLEFPRRGRPIALVGGEALRALRAILPRANIYGGKAIEVDEAVARLERAGSAEGVLPRLAEELGRTRNIDPRHHRFVVTALGPARPHRIATVRPRLRLALEIAANEELERRALEGEMDLLEQEWREAEELAAISDELLIPPGVEDWMRERKKKRKGTSGTDSEE
ncbi:MAG: hypothetical protein EA351_01565 [Gemmatimonadales bacterium]|nr:MAG: hypothetical protein EA351_01565 [Gemmatimonadales bacterium]